MAQRITRAKQKIAAANIPYRVPGPTTCLRASTACWLCCPGLQRGLPRHGDGDPVRADLTSEAIRLARILRQLLPTSRRGGPARADGAHEARREARVRHGQLVPLAEQDRAGWNRALIPEGHDLVRECLSTTDPGDTRSWPRSTRSTPSPTAADTEWSQVVALYDQLPGWTRRRSSPSTGRSPSRAGRPGVALSTGRSRCRSPATTPGTPSAPNCCADWSQRRGRRRTTPRSRDPERRRTRLPEQEAR